MGRQVARPLGLALALGRGVVDEGRQRDLRVDYDALPLGQPQHHVGAAVVPRLVLDVELRLIVHAADEVRTVENRFENHLAPVALHLRVALQRVGQIGGLGGDAAVELHEVLQLVVQRAALLVLVAVDALDPLAELGDILLEGLEQQVERFLVGLPEAARLLAQHLVGQVLELEAEPLLALLALGLLGGALLGRAAAQGLNLGGGTFAFGRSPLALGGQRGFDAHALLEAGARLGFGTGACLECLGLLAVQPCDVAPQQHRRHGQCSGGQAEHDDCNDKYGVHTCKSSEYFASATPSPPLFVAASAPVSSLGLYGTPELPHALRRRAQVTGSGRAAVRAAPFCPPAAEKPGESGGRHLQSRICSLSL